MAEARTLSGLAISHTRTALAHSMSYPLTAHLGVAHGLACALVLPAVLEFNLEADHGRLAKLDRGDRRAKVPRTRSAWLYGDRRSWMSFFFARRSAITRPEVAGR